MNSVESKEEKVLKELIIENDKKILLIVLDGLGDIQNDNNLTPLEKALTPELDKIAKNSSLGFTIPVDIGITPGSGPAHLSLFGYDPFKHQIGRGILEALGLGLHVGENDLAARGNFATFRDGLIVDRRAGRIPTEKNIELCNKLTEQIKEIEDIKVIIKPGKEHRFVVIFRGKGLTDQIKDADPQKNNKPPVEVKAKLEVEEDVELQVKLEKTIRIVSTFIKKAVEVLSEEERANYILLRGFSLTPEIENFNKLYKINSCGIAAYPMYRGLTRLIGMNTPDCGDKWEDEVKLLYELKDKFNFFYLHFKETDKAGEDGDFDKKVQYIEKFDKILPDILKLKFDVLVITGDHSTPAYMSGHSWHPNPLLIYSRYARKDNMRFTEKNCRKGSLGFFYSKDLIKLLLAHSMKLKKFGA